MSSNSSLGSENSKAFVVCQPRAGDAIGEALRGAFSGDYGLPDDMMACLRALEKVGDAGRPHA